MRFRGAIVAVVAVSACAGPSRQLVTTAPPESDGHAGHEVAGSSGAATPHPSVPAGADGSIVLENDFAIGGSGVSIGEALGVASSTAVLVRGVLLRDADGDIWLCDAVHGGTPPACASPRLWVSGFPDDEAVFDPANAADVGARTEGGMTWVENQFLFGVVHPAP